MSEPTKYYDNRADFFRAYFEKGLGYSDYVLSGKPNHKSRWDNFYNLISLSDEQLSITAQFKRKMNILVLSGIWCGDCARQGPMLRRIEQASQQLSLRFIDNRANPELQDELRINGASRVPVIVALSEDFFELARFGDRTLSTYQRKAQTELGPACDAGLISPQAEELTQELGEGVSFFERLQLMLRLAPALREKYAD